MSLSGPTLDQARRLDVRAVLRWIRKQPPYLPFADVRWSDGGSIGATLAGWKLILDYESNGAPIHEELSLDGTPCNYGGSRTWVRCPNCGERRAVLYSARATGGRFFCRTCLAWPYGSTRERAPDRALRRARTIRARQGAERADLAAVLPLRPRQRLSTYERLAAEHDASVLFYLDATDKRIDSLRRRFDSAQR